MSTMDVLSRSVEETSENAISVDETVVVPGNIPDEPVPVPTPQKPPKKEYSDIVSEDVEIREKCLQNVVKSSPLFHYMINNRDAKIIPTDVKRYHHIVSEDDKLTPLMIAVVLNNVYFVQELLLFNIGRMDTFHKSALMYANKINCGKVIIEMLREYETMRTRMLVQKK